VPESAEATPLVEVPSRPAAVTQGQVAWADGYPALLAAFAKLAKALEANGLKPAGKPLAVLVAITDDGFSFQAMVPLDAAPAGKDQLAPDVAIGATPAGRAYKFQHRSAYDDLDSTYEAITAFLDEKGVEAKDTIIEEYLTTPKDADDTTLEADIYVFPKETPAPAAPKP
jgi:effector-binding domain-containing protein